MPFPLRPLLLLLLLGAALGARDADLSQLPPWARASAEAAQRETPPADADAWVLFERTEFGYRGGGEIRVRKYRLVKILTEGGLDRGQFSLQGLGGSASRITRLQGWNVRPDGEVTRLDRNDLVTLGLRASSRFLDRGTLTNGMLDRVTPGSLIAFESQESVRSPQGAVDRIGVLETDPIRIWELESTKALGLFTLSSERSVGVSLTCRHFSPWLPNPPADATALRLEGLPPLPLHEDGHRPWVNLLPQVFLRIQDAATPTSLAVATWEDLGARYQAWFPPPRKPFTPVDLGSRTGRAALEAIHGWVQRELTYKQIYLSPERGWVPMPAEAVLRDRFGDCKDLANIFITAVRSAGMEAYPVLARIGEGGVEPDGPVFPVFNHVIAAVRLENSLGLPAEILTSQGRFLLVDCTDPLSPLGHLSEAHRSGRVLICTPKGAALSEIPPGAIVQAGLRFDLDATLSAQGLLKGTLRIREAGDALFLGATALMDGDKALEKRLAALLDFPPGSTWGLTRAPDPRNLHVPLEVEVRFERPGSLKASGGKWLLPPLGFPAAPRLIQRRGEPRFFPVYLPASHPWEVEAHIHLESPLRPLGPGSRLETPLRSATWTLEAQGKELHLHFAQTSKELDLPYEAREEGVRIQKEDRKRFTSFLEEALSVQPIP